METASDSAATQLQWALATFARLQGLSLDGLRLKSAIVSNASDRDPLATLAGVSLALGWGAPVPLPVLDRARLPLLAKVQPLGWVVVVGQKPDGRWSCQTEQGDVLVQEHAIDKNIFVLRHQALDVPGAKPRSNFTSVMKVALGAYRRNFVDAIVATVFIGLLTLMTSLFSMQVYDRVIPTRGDYTLAVLSAGVALSIGIELILKFVRSRIMDQVAVGVDNRLSREVFQRLLQLRVDQLPASVGSLAGQMRGYEQVRNFFTASTLFAIVDMPMAIIFLVIVAVIASPLVALVPLLMATVSLLIAFMARKQVRKQAEAGAKFSNMKTGLLVEAVEGIETIKSGSGGWKFLSRWLKLNHTTIENDLNIRHHSEAISYYAAALQQLSYACVVAVGALVVMKGDMTTGSLIAASILSGRILSPIGMLPSLFVQHAHSAAALKGLDMLYELKTDNHGLDRVLIPEQIHGAYRLDGVKFSYGPQQPPSIDVEKLEIKAGERVGVIGPIGSGKSTLLRLLSGMYAPSVGRVLIDGLDLSHISRDVINQHIGYLQQEHRLFQGSIRENLLIGLPDPGDEALLKVMRRTGMDHLVLSHPLGLDRPIAEGGKGLSGGQRQLLAFTRLLLVQSSVLLLDEPTANMDQMQERLCLDVLRQEAAQGRQMIIVTHKPTLLPLVDRILVVVGNQIIKDGPRDEVLRGFGGQGQGDSSAEQRRASPAPHLGVNIPKGVAA